MPALERVRRAPRQKPGLARVRPHPRGQRRRVPGRVAARWRPRPLGPRVADLRDVGAPRANRDAGRRLKCEPAPRLRRCRRVQLVAAPGVARPPVAPRRAPDRLAPRPPDPYIEKSGPGLLPVVLVVVGAVLRSRVGAPGVDSRLVGQGRSEGEKSLK